jgi:hypothetical protein
MLFRVVEDRRENLIRRIKILMKKKKKKSMTKFDYGKMASRSDTMSPNLMWLQTTLNSGTKLLFSMFVACVGY